MNIVHYNALHLIGTTIFAPRHQLLALDLILSGKIPVEKLITRYPLSEFREGALQALDGKILKAVFLP
jgi:L-iditol 2-dehydrogenase